MADLTFQNQTRTRLFINGKELAADIASITHPTPMNNVAELPDGKGGVIPIFTGRKIDGELEITVYNSTAVKELIDWQREGLLTVNGRAKGVTRKDILIEYRNVADVVVDTRSYKGCIPVSQEDAENNLTETENLHELTFKFRVTSE